MMEVEGEGEKYYQGENGEENNIEGEEGEEDIYKQQEERDTMQKTLTQEIGDDVMKIQEFPENIYYKKENFCDYNP